MLAGDALLAEAFRLALSYPALQVAQELSGATLGMIAASTSTSPGTTATSPRCTG